MLKRALIGSFLGAIVFFVWGFVFWAVLPTVNVIGQPIPNEAKVVAALREALAAEGDQSGDFRFPSPVLGMKGGEADAAFKSDHEKGPLVLMQITESGATPMDPVVFAKGFAHMFVCALVMSLLVLLAMGHHRTFKERMHIVMVTGAFAAIAGPIGKPIWFLVPWNAPLLDFTYMTLGWFLSAPVLAWALTAPKKSA